MKKHPRSVPLAAAVALIAGVLGVTTTAGVATAAGCELKSSGGDIEHVISIISTTRTSWGMTPTCRPTSSRCPTF